nr:MAG TPA: hypothetical protein [Caudoviricetes sp.]
MFGASLMKSEKGKGIGYGLYLISFFLTGQNGSC